MTTTDPTTPLSDELAPIVAEAEAAAARMAERLAAERVAALEARLTAVEGLLEGMRDEIRTHRLVILDPEDEVERITLEVDSPHAVIRATDGYERGSVFEVRAGARPEPGVSGEVDVMLSLGGNVATMFAADDYEGRTRAWAHGPDDGLLYDQSVEHCGPRALPAGPTP